MFEHMQTLPIRYFDQNTNGSIMSLYTNDTDTLRQMINQSIPQVLMSSFTIVVTFISMVVLKPYPYSAGSAGDPADDPGSQICRRQQRQVLYPSADRPGRCDRICGRAHERSRESSKSSIMRERRNRNLIS